MFGVYFSLRDATQIPFLGPSSPFKATQVVKYGQMQKQMKTPFEELHGLHVNPWQVSLAQMATRMATYIEVTPKTPEKGDTSRGLQNEEVEGGLGVIQKVYIGCRVLHGMICGLAMFGLVSLLS